MGGGIDILTIKELYDWAVNNGYENYDIKVWDDCGWRLPQGISDLEIDNKCKEIGL